MNAKSLIELTLADGKITIGGDEQNVEYGEHATATSKLLPGATASFGFGTVGTVTAGFVESDKPVTLTFNGQTFNMIPPVVEGVETKARFYFEGTVTSLSAKYESDQTDIATVTYAVFGDPET